MVALAWVRRLAHTVRMSPKKDSYLTREPPAALQRIVISLSLLATGFSCHPGYTGPLCGTCSDGYRSKRKLCKKCKAATWLRQAGGTCSNKATREPGKRKKHFHIIAEAVVRHSLRFVHGKKGEATAVKALVLLRS